MSTAISRIQLTLQDICLVSQDSAAKQQKFQASVFQQLDGYGKLLDHFPERNSSPTLLESAAGSEASFPSENSSGPTSPATVNNLYTNDDKFRTEMCLLPTMYGLSAPDTVSIATSYQRSTCTRRYCSCACHMSSRMKTPQFLEQFLGSLFVGYTGLPALGSACTESTCNRNLKPRISLSYYFPKWFLQRALSLVLYSRPELGPDLNLRTVRLIDRSADVFTYAVSGNVEGLKYLFTAGLASPIDVALNGGYTPLHVR